MVFDNTRFVDTMYCTYLMSVTSANTAEMATYPLDLTKTRLQIQGEKAIGSLEQIHQTEYRGTLRTAYGIVQEEGFLNLWRGITPAIYRHIVYSGLRIVTYEHMRHNVFKKNEDGSFPLWKAAVTGATAGAIGQFCASPADLVKVQLQMEGKRRLLGKPPRVLGAHHAFKKIWLEGGIRGLWKGWVPNVQRAALVNIGDLTAYDMTKQYILRNTNLQDNIVTHSLSSVCAGFVAALMSTPADVMKSRVMNQPTDKMGRGLLYKSSIDCVIKTVNNEGFLALYKGFIPVWMKLAPWAITFWVSYEQMRSFLGVGSF